jgi:hypothetical protein
MTLSDSDTVLRQLAEQTIGPAQHMPMAHVARAAIPAGVRAYLRASLRDRLRKELSQTDLFSRVHPHSALESRLQDVFLLQSADGYVFPREEFLADLENAVRFTENYVCRPRWTLSSFLFHDASVITTTALFDRLEYLAEYAYLPQLLRRLISQRKLPEVDRESCTQLIRQIDASVVREHAPHELAMLTRPIFRFFLSGEPKMTDPIRIQPVLLFFEDKELNGLRDHIQGICHVRGHEGVTLGELVELCEDYLVKPAKAPVEAPSGEAGTTEASAAETLPVEAPSSEAGSTEASTAETLPVETPADEAIHVEALADQPSAAEARPAEATQTEAPTGQPPAVEERIPEPAFFDATTPETPVVEAAPGGGVHLAMDAGELAAEDSPSDAGRDEKPLHDLTDGGHRPSWVAIAGSIPPETATGETSHGEAAPEEPTSRQVLAGDILPESSGEDPDAPPEKAVPDEQEATQEVQEEFAFDSTRTFSAPPVEEEVRLTETVLEFPPASPTPSVRTSPAFPDLRRMITEGQRKRFISVLCDRDADFYDLIVIRLNSMRTWHEASAYIRELFEINSIDPFKEEAITFTDIVQQRFETDLRSRP